MDGEPTPVAARSLPDRAVTVEAMSLLAAVASSDQGGITGYLAREIVAEYPDDEMGTIPMHSVVPKMSGTPGAIRMRAPKLGEHNREILAELGLDDSAIQSLSDAGVIYAGPQRKKSSDA